MNTIWKEISASLMNLFGGRTRKTLDNMEVVVETTRTSVEALRDIVKIQSETINEYSHKMDILENKLNKTLENQDILKKDMEYLRDKANEEAHYRCEDLKCKKRVPPLNMETKYK